MRKALLLLLALCLFPWQGQAQISQIPQRLVNPALVAAATPGKMHFANLSGTNTYTSINYDVGGISLDVQWRISACSACNFTIAVVMVDAGAGGTDVVICQPSAAITANGTYHFHISPDNPSLTTSPGFTTVCALRPNRTIYLRAVNSAGTATLNADGWYQ